MPQLKEFLSVGTPTAGNPIKLDSFLSDGSRTDPLPELSLAFKPPEEDSSWLESTASFLMDFVPFAKLATNYQGEADRFKELSPEQQNSTLLWETFGLAAVVIPVPGAKALKNIWAAGAAKKLAKRQSRYIKPVEDIALWPEADYNFALKKALQKEHHFTESEADAIARFMKGDQQAIFRPMLSQGGPSKEFLSVLDKPAGKGFASVRLKQDFVDKLSPREIRSWHLRQEYEHSVYDRLKVYGGERVNELLKKDTSLHKAAYQEIMQKIYGTEAGRAKKLIDATDEELVAAREFMRGAEAPHLLKSVASPGSMSMFRAVPSVMGRGEPAYKTRSQIYDVVEQGAESASRANLEKLKILDGMLVQRNLLKPVTDKSGAVVKLVATDRLTPRVQERALGILQEMSRFQKVARKENIPDIQAYLQQKIAGLMPSRTAEDHAVRDLIQGFMDFSDSLYVERFRFELEQALFRKNMTNFGVYRTQMFVNAAAKQVEEAFSTKAALPLIDRMKKLNEVLGEVRERIEHEFGNVYDVSKFSAEGVEKARAALITRLTIPSEGVRGRFHGYDPDPLQSGSGWKGRVMAILHKGANMPGRQGQAQFYEKIEKLSRKPARTLEDELVRRITQHNQFIHLAPRMRQAASKASDLPPEWKSFLEHYMSRRMHMPSRVDAAVARVLESTVGAVQRAVGRTPLAQLAPNLNWQGTYDAYDVVRIAKTINDWTYSGFLGFKPFSAMRNYLQPLLMIPTDLGGIKDIGTLARAYRALLSTGPKARALRDEIKQMGVIPEEFSGEFANQTYKALRTHHRIAGIPIPRMDEIHSAALWMFSQSHNHNCYVSAAAAMIKWDDAVESVGLKRLGKFIQKAGIKGRSDDVRTQIEALLHAGKHAEARTAFVRSVVADTQFLYGPAATPLITQAGGAVGKTAAIFQTWWMNYGDQIYKWTTTGDASMKTSRAVNFALSGAIGYGLMRTIWDHDISASTVGAGPFGSIDMLREGPPSWRVASQTLRTLYAMGGLAESERPYTDEVRKRLSALAWSSFTMLPGGLQFKQTIQRTGEEDVEGFFKSLVRYKKDGGF